MRSVVRTLLHACAVACLATGWCGAEEVIRLNAGIGVTVTSTPSLTWADQAAGGGSQNFSGTFSATPTVVLNATPTGTTAIGFNGAASNPNAVSTGSTAAFDAAPPLTFMLVLKPGELTGTTDTYLNSTVTGASGGGNGWGLYRDGTNFFANVRGTNSANSTISATTVGGLQTDWMILTGVYTPTEGSGTIQLFLTDAAGSLFSGAATTVTDGMTAGTNAGTQLGARGGGRADGAAMELAAVSIWDEALDATARLAAEKTLYQTFIGRSELGAVSVTNPSAIITGGSAAFTYTVANSGTGYGSLSFTGSGQAGVVGTSSGTAATATTSSAVSGLTFTGTTVGFAQAGTFTVSDPNAFGATSTTGTVSLTVLDHARSSLASSSVVTSSTISLGTYNYVTATWESGGDSAAFFINNLASDFGSSLTADLALTGVTGTANGFSTNLASYADIAGGGSSQFSILFDPTGLGSAGMQSTTFQIQMGDDPSLSGATATNTLFVTAQVVVVPEPISLGSAGCVAVGVALAWRRLRRRLTPSAIVHGLA